MARIVDREQRRQNILESFQRYVARVGLGEATSRGLAREAGMAAGGLWNYFDNFDEVIAEAFMESFALLNSRLEAFRRDRGLVALANVVGALLPISGQSQEEGRVALGFLTNMGRTERLYEIQGAMERRWAEHIHLHLGEAREDGELAPHADIDDMTEVLLVTVVGLQMQWAVPTSQNRTPERQWQIVTSVLRPWLLVDMPTPAAT